MKKYIALSVFAMGLGLTSCDDFLDKLPDNRADIDTKEKAVTLLVSAYPSNDYILLSEYSSDNVDDYGARNPYTDRFLDQVFAWQDITESNNEDTESLWEACYNAISSANQALMGLEGLDMNDDGVRHARGEALLCRAYNHFILVNMFCQHYDPNDTHSPGVPYVTELEDNIHATYDRGTVVEVYQNIQKDLEEGLRYVGESNYTVAKYHFNKAAAYAFATRFYLFSQQWEKAVQSANMVLGTAPSTMLRDWSVQAGMTQTYSAISQHFVDATLNCNLLLHTAYSSMGLAFGPYYVYCRYSHGAYLAGNEDGKALPALWGSNQNGYYMTMKTYSATNLDKSIFWKLPYLFEYTDPVAGIGYRHTVYPAFTADETLLSRAEAYINLGRYDEACKDMSVWVRNISMDAAAMNYEFDPETIKAFFNGIDYSYERTNENGVVTEKNITQSTVKKHLNPKFDIGAEGDTKECMLQAVLGMRRIETLQAGLRWFDVKRYGIVIPRRLMDANGSPSKCYDWLSVDDPRRALQLPKKVTAASMQANPREGSTGGNSSVALPFVSYVTDNVQQIEDKYLVK